MEVVLAFIMIVLVGVWAVWVINANQHKPRENEKFIGYINKYDSDGEPYQAQVWHVTEDDSDD
ncbi:hypothetical protein [Streptococcus sp. HMSC061D10]|uniref:hypothetical protein n=1 Tax=unclassified Streptococcus TaxID=2608887 RepID=UPI0008B5823A|nr:hypothetical protein [Streptococcus sp. HMSC061D10]OFN81193.1 hypothetical protein HMPREF2728_06650 [Streptococcus sp. HMSC061D10]